MAAADPNPVESRVLVSTQQLALLTLFVDGLPNTVLVQLCALRFGTRRSFSLYVLYREGTVTFDAVTRFQPKGSTRSLGEVLRRFTRTEAFQAVVVAPLVRDVREHFSR